MILVYIGTLVAAAGAVGVQIFAGHDSDAHGADHDAGPWSLVASVRFWSFLFLAFGLVGTMLSVLRLAGPIGTFALALGSGAASGLLAVTVIRRLLSRSASSNVKRQDVIGCLGRVVVPLDGTARGKVRIEVRGTTVDYLARATQPLAEGDLVIVEECDGEEVVVGRAPAEFRIEA